jgi:hypothetical protein
LNAHAKIKLGPMISKPRRPSVLTFSRGGTGWKIERGLWFLQIKRQAGNDCVLEAFASSKRLKQTATLEDRNGNLYARHQDDG